MRKRGEFIESGNTVTSGQLCYIISVYNVCILCVCVGAKTRRPGWLGVCVLLYSRVCIYTHTHTHTHTHENEKNIYIFFSFQSWIKSY